MKLKDNEKELLNALIENGKASDVEIAKKLKISPQAIGKIRKKLEKDGIIEGYCANLNFEKLGINCFVLFKISFLPEFWKSFTEEDIKKTILNTPHILLAGRIPSADQHLFAFEGFRNQIEMEDYLKMSIKKFAGYAKYERIDVLSTRSLIKMDRADLYKYALSNTEPDLKVPKT